MPDAFCTVEIRILRPTHFYYLRRVVHSTIAEERHPGWPKMPPCLSPLLQGELPCGAACPWSPVVQVDWVMVSLSPSPTHTASQQMGYPSHTNSGKMFHHKLNGTPQRLYFQTHLAEPQVRRGMPSRWQTGHRGDTRRRRSGCRLLGETPHSMQGGHRGPGGEVSCSAIWTPSCPFLWGGGGGRRLMVCDLCIACVSRVSRVSHVTQCRLWQTVHPVWHASQHLAPAFFIGGNSQCWLTLYWLNILHPTYYWWNTPKFHVYVGAKCTVSPKATKLHRMCQMRQLMCGDVHPVGL